jgi:hypothetical protein
MCEMVFTVYMSTTPAPIPGRTCTIPVDGGAHLCGAPAVRILGSHGQFAECAAHDAGPIGTTATAADFAPGDRVTVSHVGIDKIGTVVRVARTRCVVSVPVFTGTRRATTKDITVAIADVRPAR